MEAMKGMPVRIALAQAEELLRRAQSSILAASAQNRAACVSLRSSGGLQAAGANLSFPCLSAILSLFLPQQTSSGIGRLVSLGQTSVPINRDFTVTALHIRRNNRN